MNVEDQVSMSARDAANYIIEEIFMRRNISGITVVALESYLEQQFMIQRKQALTQKKKGKTE